MPSVVCLLMELLVFLRFQVQLPGEVNGIGSRSTFGINYLFKIMSTGLNSWNPDRVCGLSRFVCIISTLNSLPLEKWPSKYFKR